MGERHTGALAVERSRTHHAQTHTPARTCRVHRAGASALRGRRVRAAPQVAARAAETLGASLIPNPSLESGDTLRSSGTSDTGDRYSMTSALFAQVVSYIKQKGIPVVTIAEGAADLP